jgi:ATP-dependent helicase YprA (DUF1998 family)
VRATSGARGCRSPARSLIKSATGTGKTLAYLLPLVQNLLRSEPRIDRTAGTLGATPPAPRSALNDTVSQR